MSRLELYLRGNGSIAYDSEVGTNVDGSDEEAKRFGNNGLLFYSDTAEGEVWCHVDIVRDVPEQFLAHYTGEPSEDMWNEFATQLKGDVGMIGWELRETGTENHEAFQSLPPEPAAFADDLEGIKKYVSYARKHGKAIPDTFTLGAPDIPSAMELAECLRANDFGDEILVSRGRAIEGIDPDVRIDRRPDLDRADWIDETAEWIESIRYDYERRGVQKKIETLGEADVSSGLVADRLSMPDAGILLREEGEHRGAQAAAKRTWASGGFAVALLIGLLGVLALNWGALIDVLTLSAALTLPVLRPSQSGIRLGVYPSGALLAASIVPIVLLAGRVIRPDIPVPERTRTGSTTEAGVAEQTRDRLGDLSGSLRELAKYVDSESDHREVVEQELNAEFALDAHDPEVVERELRNSKLVGLAMGVAAAAALSALAYLGTSFIVGNWGAFLQAVVAVGMLSLGLVVGIGTVKTVRHLAQRWWFEPFAKLVGAGVGVALLWVIAGVVAGPIGSEQITVFGVAAAVSAIVVLALWRFGDSGTSSRTAGGDHGGNRRHSSGGGANSRTRTMDSGRNTHSSGQSGGGHYGTGSSGSAGTPHGTGSSHSAGAPQGTEPETGTGESAGDPHGSGSGQATDEPHAAGVDSGSWTDADSAGHGDYPEGHRESNTASTRDGSNTGANVSVGSQSSTRQSERLGENSGMSAGKKIAGLIVLLSILIVIVVVFGNIL